MNSHRLRHLRTPLLSTPNTSVAPWRPPFCSSHSPHMPAKSLTRDQPKGQPQWCDSGWRLSTLVCWVLSPRGHRNSRRILGGETLIHTTSFAADDEEKIRLVEAAMGNPLAEPMGRQSHRRYR